MHYISIILTLLLIEIFSSIILGSKNLFFFLSFSLLLFIIFFCFIFNKKFPSNDKKHVIALISIIAIAISVKIYFIFRYTGILVDADVWSDKLIISNIIETGFYPTSGSGLYWDHIGCANHLFLSFISLITGINPKSLEIYFVPLFICLYPVLYYIFLNYMTQNDKLSASAVILYSLTSEFIWINGRGELLIILFTIFLIFILKQFVDKNSIKFIFLFLITYLITTFSHSMFCLIITFPLLISLSFFFYLQKVLKFKFFILIFVILALIPVAPFHLLYPTLSDQYETIALIINGFFPLNFWPTNFLFLPALYTSLGLTFCLITFLLYFLYNFLNKNIHSKSFKFIFIGLILIIFFLGILMLLTGGFSEFTYAYIISVYPNLVIFFLFYLIYFFIFTVTVVWLFKDFKFDFLKNWTIIGILIFGALFYITVTGEIIAPTGSISPNDAVRFLYFVSLPLCIGVSSVLLSIKNQKSKFFACFIIIIVGIPSLLKATNDSDLVNFNFYSTPLEEDSVYWFQSYNQENCLTFVDWKFLYLIDALLPLNEFNKIKVQYSLYDIDTSNLNQLKSWLINFMVINEVNYSYIFLPTYFASNYLNFSLLLQNNSVFLNIYENPEVNIYLYNFS